MCLRQPPSGPLHTSSTQETSKGLISLPTHAPLLCSALLCEWGPRQGLCLSHPLCHLVCGARRGGPWSLGLFFLGLPTQPGDFPRAWSFFSGWGRGAGSPWGRFSPYTPTTFSEGGTRLFSLFPDIDECLSSSCEGHCVNTEGGFVCECGPGLQLSADRHSCQGERLRAGPRGRCHCSCWALTLTAWAISPLPQSSEVDP